MDLTNKGKVTGIRPLRRQQLMQGMLSLGQRRRHCRGRRRRRRRGAHRARGLFTTRRAMGHVWDRDRTGTKRRTRRLGGRRVMGGHEAGACHWLIHVFKLRYEQAL